MTDDIILRAEGIRKSYGDLEILKGVDFSIRKGESCSIVGKSGSGKSTLLNVLALLDKKDGGKIFYDGSDTDLFSEKDVVDLRRSMIGFVFQNSLLFEDFSAFENVLITLTIAGLKQKEAMEKAEDVLISVGLKERMSHRPLVFSDAGLVFLDEPTGSLDEESKSNVEELLFSHMMRKERSLVIVTHDADLSMKADSRYVLRGGILERV